VARCKPETRINFGLLLALAGQDKVFCNIICAAVECLVKSPNPRPEGDRQVVFTSTPAETSSGEPRRLREFK
jgi:hypothetical protein